MASSSLKNKLVLLLSLRRDMVFLQIKRSFYAYRRINYGFGQELPIYADPFISNTFSSSVYKSFGEDGGAAKFYISSINGLNNEDVRLSKRTIFVQTEVLKTKQVLQMDQITLVEIMLQRLILKLTCPNYYQSHQMQILVYFQTPEIFGAQITIVRWMIAIRLDPQQVQLLAGYLHQDQ